MLENLKMVSRSVWRTWNSRGFDDVLNRVAKELVPKEGIFSYPLQGLPFLLPQIDSLMDITFKWCFMLPFNNPQLQLTTWMISWSFKLGRIA